MKVKDMIEMLELADKDSQVMLEVRDKNMNSVGYYEVGSDYHETGGYNPDEIDYFEWKKKKKSKAIVELSLKIDDWVSIGTDQEEE